jgi:hypothetical protein
MAGSGLSVYTGLMASKFLIAMLALLALNAVAYGAFFVFSPEAGLGELAYDRPPATDHGAFFLVRLVGVGLLGAAGFALLAIRLVLRGEWAGPAVSLMLGATYLAVGACAVVSQLWVDAAIYGGFGVLVALLSAFAWRSISTGSAAGVGQ